MFKYVWIVMLVIPFILFVIYSAFSVYVAISDAIRLADANDTIFDIIEDSFCNFIYDHDYIPGIWGIIFVLLFICLFGASLTAYVY